MNPLLWETMVSDPLTSVKENGRRYQQIVRAAVETERQRMPRRKKRLKQAKTERGRSLQQAHDFPAVKADRLAGKRVKEVLDETDDDGFLN